MGAAFVEQIHNRPLSHFWRPSSTMVLTNRPPTTYVKLDQPINQLERSASSEALTTRLIIELQISRAHGTHHLSRLERGLAQPNHHIEHRHNLYHLGHSLSNSKNSTDRSRQRSLRRALLRPERGRLRKLRRRRQCAHVRPTQPRAQHHHLRTVRKERQKWYTSLSSLPRHLHRTTMTLTTPPSASLNSPTPHSPTTPSASNNSTLTYPPPLLRISASPHDAHLLATVSTDSPLIRILDVRQPGQALLELRGHGAAVNCIEWSPNRRGMLASGGDDSTVLIWDLMSQAGTVVPLPSSTQGSQQQPQQQQQPQPGGGERGPGAAWACEYEVSNLSWAPVGDTLGVCGGRGFWGVQM